jgi:hypothetical protein
MSGVSNTTPLPERPGPRYPAPAPQCSTCSVRTICSGCRHEDGCDWCFCHGSGCSTCGTKCRSHESRDLWQADVGTLDLELWIDRQPPLALPRFIPNVKLRDRMRGALIPWTYTVAVSDVIRADGTPRDVAYHVRDYFPEGSQVILNFFCEDHYLEPVWTLGAAFWEGEWLRLFDAIVAVNYSLYADDASFEIMHSLKRSQISAQEIHDAGHPVIPLLSYIDEKQVYELLENYGASGLHTVAINMQVVGARTGEKLSFQKENVRLMRHIARHTDWRVLAYGIARRELVGELAEIFGDRLVTSNASAYFDVMRKPMPTSERRARFTGEIRKYQAMTEGRTANRAAREVPQMRDPGRPGRNGEE